MAFKDNTAAERKKNKELKGRGKYETIRRIKKGSSMPARKKKEPVKVFYVAEGRRIGHPNLGYDQHVPLNKRVAEEGDAIELTKAQAEWCLANGFIDSVLPDFEPEPELDFDNVPDTRPTSGSSEEGSESSSDGEGESNVGGASDADDVPEAPKRASRRKAPSV